MQAFLDELAVKLEQPGARWGLIGICIVILLRFKLVLIAAALPLLAYWQFYLRQQEASDQVHEGTEEEDADLPDPWAGGEHDSRRSWFPDEPLQNGHRGGAPRREGKPMKDDPFAWDEDGIGDELDGPRADHGGGDDFDGFGTFEDSGRGDRGSRFGGKGAGSSMGNGMGGFGSGSMGGMDDFDFMRGDDMDSFGAKGKSKGKKGKPFDPLAPREANPRQVFVANVGDMDEESLRGLFEEVGEVDRVKLLRTPEGLPKGVCFVTFRTEEQAQRAIGLNGTPLGGKTLVVRVAHAGGGAGKDGMKGSGKGEGPIDLGGSERFAAFGGLDQKGKGKGKGKRNDNRAEIDVLIEEALAGQEGPIKPSDFDFAARRFLVELRSRDKVEGTDRFDKALEMVQKYTCTKDRSSVRKWPAYIFTLLQKFDPEMWDDLRERDAERKREKGAGGFGRRDDD